MLKLLVPNGLLRSDPKLQTADSNADTIPDWWCRQYGLNPTQAGTAQGNPDNDSQPTYQEWMADTDPADPESCFHIDHIEVGVKGSPVTIHFVSSSNRVSTLQCCTRLGNGVWTDVPGQTGQHGSGGLDTLSDTNWAPQEFYRVGVNMP